MIKTPKISIIVPIYNIEEHLHKCLDSIISQTLPDIEIICVNDDSSDNCQSILDHYAEKDSRIIIIQHAENKSILQARKSGVQIAKGEYILFVDGDDALEPIACDTLYETMTRAKVDICHFPTKVIGNSTKTDLSGIIGFVKPYRELLKEDNILDACFIESLYNWSIWNKIYKADLCKKAYQSAGNFYCNMAEDVYTYFIISYFGKSYLGIGGDPLYKYYYGLGMTGGDTNNGLRKLRALCEQSRIAPELRKVLHQQNASNKYYDAVDSLEKKFMGDCMWHWFNILPDSECAEGFDILLAHWDSEKVIAWLAKTHYDKQEIIAQKILGSTSLQVKKVKIKKVGVFYHRMRNGGVERVISLLIPVWIDLGYNVVFFTDEEPTNSDFPLPECVDRVVLPTSIGINPDETNKRIAALREGVLKHDIDVFIHNASSSPMLIYDLLVVKTMGIPAIVSSHECFSSSMFWRDSGIFKKVQVYKLADLVMVLTTVDLKFWTLFGINTMCIPNPLFSDVNSIRQSKLDTTNVIWVGRFAIEKQYLHPIQIFAEVVKEMPEARLLMIGKGESLVETNELRSEIERLGLAENVVLCGYHKDISHFYAMSSVYLTTSYHESFSMALIESRAFGIPTVAYELPNLDIFDDNKGAVIVPQGDKNAAASAIIQMLSNQEYRIKMGIEARQSTEIFYTENNVKDQWSKTLNQTLLSKKLPVANPGNNEDIYRRMFQSILLHYHLGLQHNKPVSLVQQTDHSVQVFDQKDHFAQLFYQTKETGFSEQDSVKTGIKENPFHFKLPAEQTFTVLRFDPINDFTIAKLNGIRLFDGNGELFVNPKITSNAADGEKATYYFLNSDPQIIIKFDEPLNLTEVMIDVDYIKIGTEVIEEFETRDNLKSEIIIILTEINQDFENQLSQKVAELEQISDDLNQKNRSCQNEINSLQSQDAALRSELNTVKSSFDYKLAKHLSSVPPVRFFQRLRERTTFTKNIRLIRQCSFFDAEYYLQNNPDVKDSGTDAVEHFLLYGGVEGRNPSEKFDSAFYLEQNPDVRASGINPLLHYLTNGKNEGRVPDKTSSAPTIQNRVSDERIRH